MPSTYNRTDLIMDVAVTYEEMPVAATTHIYAGTHVCLNSSGYLIAGGDTSGAVYVGQAMEEKNNTGSAGDVTCKVQGLGMQRYRKCAYNTPTAAILGSRVFLADDAGTVTLAGSSSNKVCVGTAKAILATGTSGIILVDTGDRAEIAST